MRAMFLTTTLCALLPLLLVLAALALGSPRGRRAARVSLTAGALGAWVFAVWLLAGPRRRSGPALTVAGVCASWRLCLALIVRTALSGLHY